MIAQDHLPGTLQGTESLNFFNWWGKIRNRLQEIKNSGFGIQQRLIAYAKARALHAKAGRTKNVEVVDDLIKDVKKDLDTYWQVMGKINKYTPEWLQADQGKVQNLGLAPLIAVPVGVAAAAALAFVATEGLRLVEKYKFKSEVMDQVAAKNLSAQEATAIIAEATKADPGFLSALGSGMGPMIGIGIAGLVAFMVLKPKLG